MFKRYVWRTVLPYFLLCWLLLTAILFLQQGSRFSEILFGANIPARLLLELSAALILSVIAFTGPMALLAGIVIGLGQMRGDSELTALQAAGNGLRTILLPCLLSGLIVSGIALLINLEGVPLAARIARRVAVETALLKLESPIEPGVFNTEFSNYVIYVRDGNNEQGVWERVFIYLPAKDGEIRLITARSGRIDAAEDKSELVLSDAVVTTLSFGAAPKPVTLDSVGFLRFSLDTGRKQLRQKLEGTERVPDEMGLFELAQFAAERSGKERTGAEILWHRRLALSFAPFFLSLLGVAVSLRFGRGGRGWGSVLSLAVLIFYYLLSLLGEQAARAELVPTFVGSWLATIIICLMALNWLWRAKGKIGSRFRLPAFGWQRVFGTSQTQSAESSGRKFIANSFESGIFGLLERDFLRNLGWYFFLTCLSLLALFHVFTTFEVLRGLATNANGAVLLAKYLILLSPMVLWQIAPTALMVAVLMTYAVKARQNETVVWGVAGQSVYVLILPSIMSAALLGFLNWEWQEQVLPLTNPRQDVLRAQLRGGAGSVGSQEGRFWVAAPEGVYSFIGSRGSDNALAKDVAFYKFSSDGISLEKMIRAQSANWQNSEVNFGGETNETIWKTSFIETRNFSNKEINLITAENPFSQIGVKTAHLSSEDLEKQIQVSDSQTEVRRLRVALQQKYATLFLPLVIVFFSTPLALSRHGRRNSLGFSIGTALGVWLLFTATNGLFERLGTEGVLPPLIAVWSPLVIFSSLGWYLLAKIRN
ncbi:MAG: LptF/LptG family permease [Pyrinomonadaceae bacterium]